MNEFVPGIELNRRFYDEVVAAILAPWPHSAGHLGWGADILGYDTPRSMDHGWGPRLKVFVDSEHVGDVRAALDAQLPEHFQGQPVRFGWDDWPVRHYVEASTLGDWLRFQLGYDAAAHLDTIDWLLTPQQKLLGVVRGAVYHDGLGTLTALRAQLAYYPDDVWHWMLACQWQRISQDEAFAGRTAEVGDELGSRLLAARQVRELMRLHFLYARAYWPYLKWFGTAYRELPGAADILPIYDGATAATDFPAREHALTEAYEALARMHNDSGLPPVDDPTVRQFHSRQFLVLDSERFVNACLSVVTDESLRALLRAGAIDQWVDNTDILERPDYATRLRTLYVSGRTRRL